MQCTHYLKKALTHLELGMLLNMDSRQVILVNKDDKKIGYGSVEIAHSGRGKHHRAFVTLLFDSQNRVLLQRRKHKLFDGFWDFTAISHPLRINGKTETYQQASDRALKKEMGIEHVQVRKVGAFNYFARDGENCENEFCAVLVGNINGQIQANSSEVYDYKRVPYGEFISDVKNNPTTYTPWAVKAIKIVKKNIKGV